MCVIISISDRFISTAPNDIESLLFCICCVFACCIICVKDKEVNDDPFVKCQIHNHLTAVYN